MDQGKLIIFSAPSGSGKSTIVRHLLRRDVPIEFSVSATNRAPRGREENGVDYYFLSSEEFKSKIDADEFLEWEEVYQIVIMELYFLKLNVFGQMENR